MQWPVTEILLELGQVTYHHLIKHQPCGAWSEAGVEWETAIMQLTLVPSCLNGNT